MRDSALLDHTERTLAEAYRKELDQEENVWRSLPFFAATLALQLAALFQIIERFPPPGTPAWNFAAGSASLSGASSLVALLFLAASIFPARFIYIAPEPELLDFASRLEHGPPGGAGTSPVDAVGALKTTLSRQYAVATNHNRQINQRRARWRSIAGLGTLMSVIAILALVSTIAVTYLQRSH